MIQESKNGKGMNRLSLSIYICDSDVGSETIRD